MDILGDITVEYITCLSPSGLEAFISDIYACATLAA